MYAHRLNQEKIDDTHVKLTGNCVITYEPYSVVCDIKSLDLYINGGLKVQEAFPDMSADDREFLISGCSPKGWNELFGGSDD